MTNAGIVDSADGPVLTLTYKGGEKKVVVPANPSMVTYEPGKKEDVKPGIGIIAIAAEKLPDLQGEPHHHRPQRCQSADVTGVSALAYQ
jgi:hypothetical protein